MAERPNLNHTSLPASTEELAEFTFRSDRYFIAATAERHWTIFRRGNRGRLEQIVDFVAKNGDYLPESDRTREFGNDWRGLVRQAILSFRTSL
jgi:hypothetical protein